MTTGVFVGLSTIDVVYSVDAFPSANSKVTAKGQDVFVGGPATNASITFSHLGGKPTLVTTVGRNVLTSVVRKELQRYSIQLIDLSPAFDQVPVISSISVNGTGKRNIVSANGARMNGFGASVNESVLQKASVVLVDGHYMQACQTWAAAASDLRTPVVLDGGSWKEGTEELLKMVDTAICSADFMPPECSTKDEVLSYLKDCGVTNVAVTNGAESIRFVSDLSSGTVQVPYVPVVDTLGAGDIFHGAFCYYASLGQGFVEALGEATRVATQSCRFHGAREWMKDFNR